jgi:hypothetical protein
MKYITKNLVIHAVIFLLASFLFRYLISLSLSNGYFSGVWIVAAVYFLSLTLMIWKFSILDKKHLPLYDLGFRFHVATYIVWVFASYTWFMFGNLSTHENMIQLHISSIIWFVILGVHFAIFRLTRKKSFKGLKKSEIFD